MGPTQDNVQQTAPVVLAIDDSVEVHRLLNARLRSESMSLRFAVSGEEGLRLAMEVRPSVILLDLEMPDMDGFEVLRALKSNEATFDTPVIVLSGLDGAADKVTAFDLGAHDYVTKPFDFTELKVRVRAALRLSSLLNMLSMHAQRDGLTGLWNRRYFDARWAEELAAASRHGRALSVALVDLDHFKSINDTFGHPAGDAVLEGFAAMLKSLHRASDIACRYGGEEIAIIMPETGSADGAAFCERVRTTLEQMTWPKHPERRVTASIGIAGAGGSVGVDGRAWLEIADKNLYEAKSRGRNRVVASEVTDKGAVRLKAG